MAIADFLKEIWKYTLGAEHVDWRIKLAIFVFLLCFGLFRSGLKEDDSRIDLIRWIRRGTYKARYQEMLLWLLTRTDRWFLSERQYSEFSATSWQRAFSISLFEKSLALAFVYAPVLFFAQLLLGIEAQIGERRWIDISTDQLIWVLLFFALVFATLSKRLRWLGILLACSFIYWWWPFPPDGSALDEDGAFLGYEIAMTVIFSAVTAAFLAFAALNWPRPFGPLLALTFTAILGLGALAALLGYRESMSWWPDLSKVLLAQGERLGHQETNNLMFAQFFLDRIWLFSSIVLSIAVILVGSRFFRDSPNRLSVSVLMVVSLLVFQVLMANGGWGNPVYFILFASLPLLNAIFDFVSIGATRFFMRRGVRKIGWPTLKWSSVDLGVALLVFFVLGCFCLGWIHFLNIVSPSHLIAVKPYEWDNERSGLLVHLMDGSANHNWFFLVLLSTLIPTVFHASIALFALGPGLLSRNSFNRLAMILEQSSDHYFWRNLGLAILSIWATVSFMIPVIVLSLTFSGVMALGSDFRSLVLLPFEVFLSWLPDNQSSFPDLNIE